MSPNAAYVTLLTKTSYLPGALVLDYSLRSVNSQYPLVVMATPTLPEDARALLKKKGIAIKEVGYLHPAEGVHSLGGHDPRFADTWTKLRGFDMYDYDRVVLLDSDMIVMRNMDELMDLELPKDWIAAAHACACNPRKFKHYPADWIPENCAHTPLVHPTALTQPSAITDTSPRPYGLLNSGLVVLNPSPELAEAIGHYLATSPLVPTFSFPDQDLLAAFFKGKWKPLPWCYNALKTLRVIHKPLWRDDEIRCLHYILDDKPWQSRVGEKGTGGDYEDLHRWWWERLAKLGEEMKVDDPEGWELVLQNVAKE
jgi:alpha-N-acetylglucosamine transferase